MRVDFNSSYNKTNYHCKKENNYSALKTPSNINFKADPISISQLLLSYKVSRKVESTRKKWINILKQKKCFAQVFENPQKHAQNILPMMDILGKVKSNIDESWGYIIFMKDKLPRISEMKQLVLTKLFPLLDDNRGMVRNSKKEYMQTLFESGEYQNKSYVKTFKNMSDSYYSSFKKELADKVFYSISNSKLPPEHYVYNLAIIKTMDNDNYASYLQSNINGFNNLMKNIYDSAIKRVTQKQNEAFKCYSHNFKYFSKSYDSNDNLWQEYYEPAFYTLLKSGINNSQELAEKLKIDLVFAEDITKDLNTTVLAEKEPDKEIQLDLFKQRIEEKFDKNIWNDNSQTSLNLKKMEKTLDNIKIKYYNICNFIERTDYEKELKLYFKDKLENLEARISTLNHKINKIREEHTERAIDLEVSTRL